MTTLQINTSYRSSTVMIGTVPLGGDHPIRIQSMANTDTLDTGATVEQCIRIIEAGADFVRLTAQGIPEAKNLANIKKELLKAGFETPLIADIHFNPSAAEIAAAIVEKIRINPGNYTDKRASFRKVKLSENEYQEELERIHSRLLPLIKICNQNKTAIRVGVNHGSLSDRILTRYGNTPSGMAISAMEFIRVFRAENFHKLVLSMKSSDTAAMIKATRELVRLMTEEGFAYPLHLGVTEAGEGEDGRVRSAAGIGALLSAGIGDTIRVSLSEDPEKEIPVARKIADYFPRGIAGSNPVQELAYIAPVEKPQILNKINGPVVITNITSFTGTDIEAYKDAGFLEDKGSGALVKSDGAADLIITTKLPETVPDQVSLVVPYRIWYEKKSLERIYPLFSPETYIESSARHEMLNIILTGSHFNIELLKRIDNRTSLFIFTFDPEKERFAADKFLKALEQNELSFSVVLNPVYRENSIEDLRIRAASLLGRYLTDKRISGISIVNKGEAGLKETTALSFSILQCTETRITRTMYLSCPTCGRTKFDLQKAVQEVKEKTIQFKGLKIAVMGCIVNGPGEMAGADWGYVGASEGKVHIYKGTVAVLKNVPEEIAADELVRLIQAKSGDFSLQGR
jgi:(E)-4-hydroxy-3-methylbut-2-enyl-diphosphate synthase